MRALIRTALAEDLGRAGDLTSQFFVPARQTLKGRIVLKENGVVCGTAIAVEVFRLRGCHSKILVKDGIHGAPGQSIMTVTGNRRLLGAERVALNFLQRMSGVATLTSTYVRETKGTKAKIYDTRKTIPGWRLLDKYAVKCGGGRNHRMGLYDAVLVKDNHWTAGMDVAAQVKKLRRAHPKALVELEAADMGQVYRALAAGADAILLDNMPVALLKKAIRLIRARSKAKIEISGGVALERVTALARLGPDRISVGRLTHSAPALDMSLEVS